DEALDGFKEYCVTLVELHEVVTRFSVTPNRAWRKDDRFIDVHRYDPVSFLLACKIYCCSVTMLFGAGCGAYNRVTKATRLGRIRRRVVLGRGPRRVLSVERAHRAFLRHSVRRLEPTPAWSSRRA